MNTLLPALTRRSQETPAQGLLVAARSLDAPSHHRHGAAMSTILPLTFPGLQSEARRLAEEAIAAAKDPADARRLGTAGGPMSRAFARLLADLTRAESQCFWLRALATRYGLTLPALGAPTFERHVVDTWRSSSPPVADPVQYHLRVDCMVMVEFHDWPWEPTARPGRRVIRCPGIRVASPIEGLRLALCAVFGVAP